MIAGVLKKDYPLERAELALTIIPGQYGPSLQSVIARAVRSQGAVTHAGPAPRMADEEVGTLARRIACILEAGQALARSPAPKSARSEELLARTMARVVTIHDAFISTGLDSHVRQDRYPGRAPLALEKEVAAGEIQWRLRDIARDLALHCAASVADQVLFNALIGMLDDDTSTPVYCHGA
jgi:hypothetical protein